MSNGQAKQYKALLYPVPAVGTPGLGVCLSGGGSRALTCALGQLSALTALAKSNPGAFGALLSPGSYLSCVSGGSWAGVNYTYLPSNLADANFLISIVDPDKLFLKTGAPLNPANMATIDPHCLGTAPQNFADDNVVKTVILVLSQIAYMYFDGMDDAKKQSLFGNFGMDLDALLALHVQAGIADYTSLFWILGVGQLILKGFGLYQSVSNQIGYANRSLSSSLAHLKSAVIANNPGLTPDGFYLVKDGRPNLIVNFNLKQSDADASPEIPVQATPVSTGIVGQSPDGTIRGGGSVESFAFASQFVSKAGGSATVGIRRDQSLCDIAGCSSAFFADNLAQGIRPYEATIVKEIEKVLKSLGIDPNIAPFLARLVMMALLDAKSFIVPRYNYWPAGGNGPNTVYEFSDGGNFDNSGILGLLAQTGANKIVSFINTETPVAKQDGYVVVDDSLPLLFGFRPYQTGKGYVSYGGFNPGDPLSYVHVFEDQNGAAFGAVRNGLYNSSCGGQNQDANLGTHPAFYRGEFTTVDNPVAGIKAGRKVEVLFVYNNRVNAWQNRIADPMLKMDLKLGQSANPSGALAHFPNYPTLSVHLVPEAVNMLAQQCGWVVNQLQGEIEALLAPATV